MEFLWSRQEKLEGPDNKGGATISSCVEQLIGGISDILSLENILEATASILEDDEDENELEDELLLQCGSGKACGVDKEGDECPFDTQTKEELSSNVQPAISDSTEPVSGHNPTEILTDNETAEDNHVTVQNNQDLKPSDNTPVHQPSLISQECQEPSKESYAQTPSPDAINGTLSENTEKCDHSLVFDSNKGTAHREEEHARELVSNEREVSTTSSDINTVQSEQAANSHADTLDQTIDLPQENILIEATSPQIETRVQEEMVVQSVCLSMLQAEPEEVSATMSPTPGGEDMQESDACNPGSFPLTADPVSITEPEGESDKAGDSNLSPVPQMMETIVEEDNVSSKSVLDTEPQISSSEPDPEHAYTDAKLNQISSSELDPEHTDTDAQLNPDTDTEPKPSSSPIGPLSSTPAHSQDQQGALVSDEPEGGQTAPPNAPALEQGDGEDYRKGPIDGEQELPVTFTDPDTHSLTEPPEQEPVVTAAAAKLQDQESGDQPPAPEPAPLVPAPEPASQLLPPDSLHAKPENLPLGLTAQDSAAVGQEVTSMEQKGEEASSADDPSIDRQVNGEEEPRQQPIAEQHDKPETEESLHQQPIVEQLAKPELVEARSNKQEGELELETKEDSEESGDDAQQENGTQNSLSSQSLEETASADSPPTRTKYNTVCYRKIKRGNTKQRIDEFESMMNV